MKYLEEIIKAARKRLTGVQRQRNALQLFHRLPVEMVVEIVQSAAAETDPGNIKTYYANLLSLRTVSYQISQIIDKATSLWNQVTPAVHPDLVTLILRNSLSRKLKVNMVDDLYPGSSFKTYSKRVTAQCKRWQTFAVDVSKYKGWETRVSQFRPALTVLEVQANQLMTTLARFTVELPSVVQPSQLSNLKLDGQLRIKFDSLSSFLNNAHNLKTLSLCSVTIDTTSHLEEGATITLPKLETFLLRGLSRRNATLLLDRILTPNASTEVGIDRVLKGPTATALLQSIHARVEQVHSQRVAATVHIEASDATLLVRWGEPRRVTLQLDRFPDATFYEQVFGRCEHVVGLCLSTTTKAMFASIISVLHHSWPNVQALSLVDLYNEDVIDVLARPMREGDGEEWLLPKIGGFGVHKAKKGRTFDKVLELVEARGSCENVASLRAVKLMNGAISETVIHKLKKLGVHLATANLQIRS